MTQRRPSPTLDRYTICASVWLAVVVVVTAARSASAVGAVTTTTTTTALFPLAGRGQTDDGRRRFAGLSPRSTTQSLVASRPSVVDCAVSAALFPRGGALDSDDDDDDYEEEEDDEEEEEEDDDDNMAFDFDDGAGMAESDFAEDNLISRTLAAWKKTPPVTKAYLSASTIVTVYGFLMNKNQFPNVLLLDWKKVLTRLQIWRPFTSFLNFGPFGLSYALTAQFVWVYMSTLERLNHSRPYDFWIMILFGQLSMVFGYPALKPIMNVSPRFLGHNLSTFLVYIWSRYHEGVDVNMFELFNTKAELLPWFFLAQTFLLEGEPPVLDFLGIVFGHIYHHCKTIGMLRAPESLRNWYEHSPSAERIRELYKPVSADFAAV
jgi:Derlin-2/3